MQETATGKQRPLPFFFFFFCLSHLEVVKLHHLSIDIIINTVKKPNY